MAGPHRRLLQLGVLVGAAYALVEGLILALLLPLLGSLMGGTAAGQATAGFGINLSSPQSTFGLIVGGLLLRQTLSGAVQTIGLLAGTRIVTHVRTVVLQNIFRLNFSFLDSFKPGHFREIAMVKTQSLQGSVNHLSAAVSDGLSGLVIIGLMLYLSPLLTALVFAVALSVLPLKIAYARLLHRTSRRSATANMSLMEALHDALGGARQIKLLGREAEFVAEVGKQSTITQQADFSTKSAALWEPILLQGLILLIIAGLSQASRWSPLFPLADVVAYTAMLYRAAPSVGVINATVTKLLVLEPPLSDIYQFFTVAPERLERPATEGKAVTGPTRIEARQLAISYGGGRQALRDVSFTLEMGRTVAFAGESGSGKSTLVHALLGMYPAESGTVTVDGVDIGELALRSLRSSVALVSQDVHLFNTTIGDVIRGGSDIDDDAVWAAAEAALADGFIRALPDGLDTAVGERGAKLSGGQRQRLFLAQALARRTPVLILDEATSALDVATEERILANLRATADRRMLLIVTHRLANLDYADEVYYFADGRIAAHGTPDELKAKGVIRSANQSVGTSP